MSDERILKIVHGFVIVRSFGDREYWVRLSEIQRVDVEAKTMLLGGQLFSVHEDDWDPLLRTLASGNSEV